MAEIRRGRPARPLLPTVCQPYAHQEGIADLVEAPRRQIKYGPARLAAELEWLRAVTVASATASSCVAA